MRNGVTLFSSTDKMQQYAAYAFSKLVSGYGTARIPMGGRIKTSSFSEYLSVYGLMPDSSEIALMKNRVRPDSIVFDIGANVGTWTVLLDKICSEASIHAFEPSPPTFSLLRMNIDGNHCKNVSAVNSAASAAEGELEFQVPTGVSIFGRVQPVNPGYDQEGRFENSATFKVRALKLSDYCAEEGIKIIDFMKIDVEGHELAVLRGLEPLMREQNVKAIYIETMEDNHLRMGTSYQEFLDFFGGCGYGIFMLGEDGQPGKRVEPGEVRAHNHLCIPV